MSLEDKIQETLVTDTETVLESKLEEIGEFLQLHQDGTIVIEGEYRDVDTECQILIYLIGQRYAKEGNLADSDTLSSSYFYERFEDSDRTVRDRLQDLRESGLITKEGQSEHCLVAENLPDSIERIQEGESE
ncbi:hypothetical protein EGH22_16635 [Halomicroarcula sp. F28]|uniref:hypothetical protein n=1 Tax=Haloarcula salinisoli TaxID=2487746 RepID=UPI001C732998|nr:hypothetical protein [Halomicroarcula salinisoli]MBX0287961.1 hypothetical protein [Halomicroarcula salinisoli]